MNFSRKKTERSKRDLSEIRRKYLSKIWRKERLLRRYFLFCFHFICCLCVYCNLRFAVFYNHKLKTKKSFFIVAMECDKKKTEEKTLDCIEEELLSSLIDIEKKDETGLDNAVRSVKDPKEAVAIIKECKYVVLPKGQNQKIIYIVVKQGELLKQFKQSDGFFEGAWLSRPNIYFKNRLFKLLSTFWVVKNSSLSSNCFKNNLKINKEVCY